MMPIKIRFHNEMCDGCTKGPKMSVFPYVRRCTVYPWIPSNYLRALRCPFNPPVVLTTKQKQRIGQQKGYASKR